MCVIIFVLACCQTKEGSWEKAKAEDTIQAYEDFLKEYNEGEMAEQAEKRICELNFKKTQKENTVESYEKFLGKYPNSEHTAEIKDRIVILEYEQAKKADTAESYEKFLSKYPNSKYTLEIKDKIIELEYEQAKKADTAESYEKFLSKYPNNKYFSEIKDKLSELKYIQTKKKATNEAYYAFLRDYPNSKYSKEIIGLIKPKKYFGNKAIKTITIWPINKFYELLRPKPKTLAKKDTLTIEGILVNQSGSRWKGMKVELFMINDQGTACTYFYGSDIKTGVIKSLNPESKSSDSTGHFLLETGPLWKIANFFIIGITAKSKGAGFAETTIRGSVDSKLKSYITGLNESKADYRPFAIIPVMEGERLMKIPLDAAHKKINVGVIKVTFKAKK